MRFTYASAASFVFVCAMQAKASVTVYNNRAAWLNSVGAHEFIGFTEYPEFTNITTQYDHQGVVFTDGNEFVSESGNFNDGHGVRSFEGAIPGTMRMSFANPRWAIGFDYNAFIQLELRYQGSLVYSSGIHLAPELFSFTGFLSSVPFDQAIVRNPVNDLVIVDNIYFSQPVPASSALALLVLAVAIPSVHRRRSWRAPYCPQMKSASLRSSASGM